MAKKKKNEAIGLDVQLSKSEAFIEKHFKKILYGIAVVCVIVIGFYIWNNYQDGRETEAAEAIAAPQSMFAAQQYQVALSGDSISQFGFIGIIDKYSGTKTANLAKFYAGICYFNLEKYDEALSMFNSYSAQDDECVSPSAMANIGNCLIEKNDKEKGAETLVEAANKADNSTLSPIFLFKAAQVYKKMGKADKALELYKQIKQKYYKNPIANDIDKYIEGASK